MHVEQEKQSDYSFQAADRLQAEPGHDESSTEADQV